MARDPGSRWSPLPEAGAPDGLAKTQMIFHSTGTMASAAANFRYFSRGDVVVESTFIVGLTPADPTLQIMDSTDRADANGSANGRGISVEVVGDGVGGYTDWQISELIRIGRWARQVHGILPRIIPSETSGGFGWHVMFGAPGPWTSVRGKVCPGNLRIRQLHERVFPGIFADPATVSPAPTRHVVKGGIRVAYDRPILNGATWGFFLGQPKGPEALTWTRDAFWQEFDKGAIYAHGGLACVVWGGILERWRVIGSEATTGYPVTDERTCPDLVGRYNHFRNGWSIYWSPSTGAWDVHGWFRDEWERRRWEAGELGYPTSSEYQDGGQTVQDFQRGQLRLHPNHVEVIVR